MPLMAIFWQIQEESVVNWTGWMVSGVVAFASLSAATPLGAQQTGETFRDRKVDGSECVTCPEMVVIPAGSFRMDDLDGGGDSDEKPVHRVTIPNKFAVGKFEVTRNEFSTFVNATGYSTSGECYYHTGSEWKKSSSKNWRSPGFSQTDRDPVVCVDWNDAKAYVRWLSGKTGKGYRLLSEAEWEYAARSGTLTKYHFGNDISSNQANFNRDVGQTTPVGSYPSNTFGLHDMHGNAWEWTEDCYQDSYRGTPTNGNSNTESDSCIGRVLRGGSWGSNPRNLRAAIRLRRITVIRSYGYGFRVARTL
jgi:formylglycine-generating enzyme required for sulfatase activity